MGFSMDSVIYRFGRVFIALVQFLPLSLVARLGRIGGGIAFRFCGRHRRVSIGNLTMCFGSEKSAREIFDLAKENFKRIGENYASAVKTAGMRFDQLKPHLEFRGFERIPAPAAGEPAANILMAIGHFGNFELYARIQEVLPNYQGATTYRSLKQPAINRLLQSLRGGNGCLFFERRSEGRQLRDLMNQGGVLLGLLSDQNSAGVRGPFLGHDCNTGVAPAVFALRYHCTVYSVNCYRISLAKWRLEVGEEIATHENGQARGTEAIMGDVNRALENIVRRDPANWFWVHRRWKT